MDNNNFSNNGTNGQSMAQMLMGMVSHADKFLEMAKTGDGLGLTDEQKKEFIKQAAKSGAIENLEKAKKLKEDLNNILTGMTNNGKV